MREMKDSGVEWIGEIPEDWNVGKTLYALSMPITDGPHETPELFDEGIPFISAEADIFLISQKSLSACTVSCFSTC
jgi:type I restriction enzyme S subunit